MKRNIALFLSLCVMLFALTACGSSAQNNSTAQSEAQTQSAETSDAQEPVIEDKTEDAATADVAESDTATAETEEPAAEVTNTLVVYFSATGTTKGVAETIADALSADLYEITPAEPYTDEDLNYNDRSTRATVEQNDSSARPAIDGTIENWDQYEVVIIGYPIWWGEEPRIMDTFVESYDFTGKTVTTFCTSGGSSIGNSGRNLESNAGSGTWLAGQRFGSSVTAADITSWVSDMGIEFE